MKTIRTIFFGSLCSSRPPMNAPSMAVGMMTAAIFIESMAARLCLVSVIFL